MKKPLTIFAIIFCLNAGATNYYISATGSDAAAGTSAGTAWRTINKVNTSTFLAGDTIFFNKGDTWREILTVPSPGSVGANIVFASYGTGIAPAIYGSTSITTWIAQGGNVWKSAISVSDPSALAFDGNIYFIETNGNVTWGRVEKAGTANLAVEYDWTWVSNFIYVYAATDPNTRYSRIEVSQRTACVELNGKNYLTFDGLELAYAASKGLGASGGQNDLTGLTIRNCHIHHIGIKSSLAGFGVSVWHSNMLIKNNTIHDCGRRSISLNNAVPTGKTISNIIVEGNTLYHGFHTTGIDINNLDAGVMSGIILRDNLIYDDISESLDGVESYSSNGIFTAIQGPGTGVISGLEIYRNLFINTTMRDIQLSNNIQGTTIYNNTFYGVNPNLTTPSLAQLVVESTASATIKNNIFYNNVVSANNPTFRSVYIGPNATATIDYNLYYCTDAAAIMIYWKTTGYTMSQWATYKSVTTQDTHSPTPANPIFVSTSDFHLQSNSPAINAGINVGLPYSGSAPDIGAFEFNNGCSCN